MATSLVYRSVTGYDLLMRVLYGRHYGDRHRAIAALVPEGASVLELCCGPAHLYTVHLRERGVRYTGLDVNERFLGRLRRCGGDARRWDLHEPRPLPPADVVVIQASLYHFLPDAHAIVDRMLAAARIRVVVSEPVRNLATSRNRVVAWVGRRATDPGVGSHDGRFDEPSLDALMDRYRDRVGDAFLIPGGREKVYVLDAGAAPSAHAA